MLDGSVAAAAKWLDAIRTGDHARAWDLTGRELRAGAAGAWSEMLCQLGHTSGRLSDDACQQFADDPPADLLPAVQEHLAALFRSAWRAARFDEWGWIATPRPVAPDIEAAIYVRLPPGGRNGTVVVSALAFLVRLDEAGVWRVIGFDEPANHPRIAT